MNSPDSYILIPLEKVNSVSIDSLPNDGNIFIVTINYGCNAQWKSSPQIFEIAKSIYNDVTKITNDYLRKEIDFQIMVSPQEILRKKIQSYNYNKNRNTY